ncbi:MAG: ATP-binding cassette domain-containing protein [Candidatus Cloacimonadales bacterium]|jgi:ABC-2 type transport system ATP-binding protein|nr:ATP-binding cassette domain-containing protein [Candidatus Cloacimonadota bacterium]MDD2651211.1 ATP-binding cassette domain-containing protein [Candidatus Cloacimonadota bacterium]MDX9978150.1 ATP-binding cassette domain-containing protein [Candidatus Cloacimonadales bacterium]
MNNILELKKLHKEYENVIAVNSIDLDIPRGSIFGLLGPNGAGKTSMIRIITHITMLDSGSITFNFNEKGIKDYMNNIGYLPEERGLYPEMKIGEQLMFFAQMKGLSAKKAKENINHWLQKLDMEDWYNKKAQELSKGMQQLVQFVASIVHDPELLIFDEPFSGLDPINTERLKKEIVELAKRDKTIIFSTHQMSQVEEICDEIALIDKGVIILEGKLKDIKNRFKKDIFEIKYNGQFQSMNIDGLDIELVEDGCALVKNLKYYPNSQLLKMLSDHVEIYSFTEILPSLNEIFIEQVTRAKNMMEAKHE